MEGIHVHKLPAHEAPRSFWRRYIFSTDHKVIGLQYMFTALFFLFVGGLLAWLFRWQLAYPGKAFPILGPLFLPGKGEVTGAAYSMLVTMHAMILVFWFLATFLVSGLGNYLVPLMIGARDMAFPFLNMLSYWIYFLSGVVLLLSFLAPGGAAGSGWYLYPPLSAFRQAIAGSGLGTDLLIVALALFATSGLFGAINFVTTIINMRAPGMTWNRLPLFVWAQFIVGILMLLAFPPAVAGFVLLLVDRNLGTTFFLAQGAQWGAVGDPTGGNPILYQHLFWFLGHPEVYVLILPIMGVASEIISTFSRKPIFGYSSMVGAMVAIAFLGFIVWAHHMFVSGMNPFVAFAFMTSTFLIAVPSGIKVFNWLATLWGGRIQFKPPMLYALGFLATFIIGGLSGLFHAAMPVDMYFHDTYFVVGHLHYMVAIAGFMGVFGALTYWFPKFFGRELNPTLTVIHFWGTFLSLNLLFFPMHWLGLMGHPRRIANPYTYSFLQPFQGTHVMLTHTAILVGLFQLLMLFNIFYSLKFGKRVSENPWKANTLEWSTSSPPPPHNFEQIPTVHRYPYEYGHPSLKDRDWVNQAEPAPAAGGE